MQEVAGASREEADRLPHDKVVGPQIALSQVRCSILVKGRATEAKENRGGDTALFVNRLNHETKPRPDGFFKKVAKKRERLGRKTMPPAGLAMQVVEIQDRLEALRDPDAEIALFGLANGAPD